MSIELRTFIDQVNEVNKNLSEGASDILYHFTSKINQILETNEFILRPTFAYSRTVEYEKSNKKLFFMSTTRSKSSGYKSGNTKIVLDGRKLKQRYKIIPVDYWNWEKKLKSSSISDLRYYIDAMKSLEQEDRIVSDKPIIPNASDYILSIHYLRYGDDDKYLKRLSYYCEKHNIPLYAYATPNDFKSHRNSIELNKSDDLIDTKEKEYKLPYSFLDVAALVSYNNEENRKLIHELLKDSELIDEFETNMKKEITNHLKYNAIYDDETLRLYINSFKNMSDEPGNKYTKFLIDLAVKDMKRLKVRTLDEYIKAKQSIGKNSKEFYKEKIISSVMREIRERAGYYIEDYLGGRNWVELIDKNGEEQYYNSVLESSEIMDIVEDYINILISTVTRIIRKEPALTKLFFGLESYELQEIFDVKKISVTDKVKITDSSYGGIEEIDNYIIRAFEKIMPNISYWVHSITQEEEANYEAQFKEV